jgi:hypothetical protein
MTEHHAERFGDALDAIVTGQGTRDPDPLVTFALALQGAEGAPNADPLDADRRAAIWRALIAGHDHPPTTEGPGPLAQPAMALPASPWRRRIEPRSRRNGFLPIAAHVQPFVTAVALVGLLLAAWGSFVSMRETGSPSVTPTAYAHGSAIASPHGSPAAEKDWLTFITLDECTATPMPRENYARLVGHPRSWPVPAYTPLGMANRSDAEAVVWAAREHEACQAGGTQPTLETDRYVYENADTAYHALARDERLALDLERGMRVSEQYPDQKPVNLAFLTSEEPPEGAVSLGVTPSLPKAYALYLPDQAIQLADGRIGIPRAILFSSADALSPSAEALVNSPHFATYLMVFTNESGEWLLDERLPFCIGDCTELWDRHLADLGLPALEATPVATPIATPRD